MKILHTSDWHLDAKLEQNSRAAEHELFFQWLRETLISEKIDALLVAGDVFDSPSPGNASVRRYSQFLRNLYRDAESGKSRCKNVIVTAGNHDSPSFLRSSEPFLEILGMHILAQPTENLREMLIPIQNTQGKTRCLILAVPFLRERDLGPFMERSEELSLAEQTLHAFRKFYRKLTDEALLLREEILQKEEPERFSRLQTLPPSRRLAALSSLLPLAASGHLFAANCQTFSDDGVRPIHVGTLDQFPASEFPPELDYVALGHLHVPQIVGGNAKIRYSGSPIPIGFSEISTPKQVVILEIPEISPTDQISWEEIFLSAPENPSEANSAFSDKENSDTYQEKEGDLDKKKKEQKEKTEENFSKTPFSLRIFEKTIPAFRTLKVLRGDFSEIRKQAKSIQPENLPSENLSTKNSPESPLLPFPSTETFVRQEFHVSEPDSTWIKAVFTGQTYELTIRDQIEELFQTLPHLRLIHFENQAAQRHETQDGKVSQHEDLRSIEPNELFSRFLDTTCENLSEESRRSLMDTFDELLAYFQECKNAREDQEN